MLQAAKIDEKKLAAIFDGPQLRALRQAFEQAKGMEPQLKQQGVMPD
jgi:hypothetical protein